MMNGTWKIEVFISYDMETKETHKRTRTQPAEGESRYTITRLSIDTEDDLPDFLESEIETMLTDLINEEYIDGWQEH